MHKSAPEKRMPAAPDEGFVSRQYSKNLVLLNWLGTLFFGFVPGLILYVFKADDAYVHSHAKEALNWSITAALAYLLAGLLTIIKIGVLLFPLIGVCHFIFCALGMVAALKGKAFELPFAVRLLR